MRGRRRAPLDLGSLCSSAVPSALATGSRSSMTSRSRPTARPTWGGSPRWCATVGFPRAVSDVERALRGGAVDRRASIGLLADLRFRVIAGCVCASRLVQLIFCVRPRRAAPSRRRPRAPRPVPPAPARRRAARPGGAPGTPPTERRARRPADGAGRPPRTGGSVDGDGLIPPEGGGAPAPDRWQRAARPPRRAPAARRPARPPAPGGHRLGRVAAAARDQRQQRAAAATTAKARGGARPDGSGDRPVGRHREGPWRRR